MKTYAVESNLHRVLSEFENLRPFDRPQLSRSEVLEALRGLASVRVMTADAIRGTALELVATGDFTKQELCESLSIARPTLDRWLVESASVPDAS